MDDGDNGDRQWLWLDGGGWMWLANAERLDGVEHRRLDELDLDVVREGRQEEEERVHGSGDKGEEGCDGGGSKGKKKG